MDLILFVCHTAALSLLFEAYRNIVYKLQQFACPEIAW
jgi:hypothetical protein